MNKAKVIPILVYFLAAFGLTFAFSQLPKGRIGPLDCTDILCGWGPLFSALACYQFFKLPNQYAISLKGAKPYLTWGIVGLALLLPFLTINTSNKTTILSSVVSQFVYSLGEEFGWRHYLQNATAGLNAWGRYLLIGSLWFLWHYSFTNDPVRAMTGQSIPALIGIPLSVGGTVCIFLYLGRFSDQDALHFIAYCRSLSTESRGYCFLKCGSRTFSSNSSRLEAINKH